MLNKSLFLFFFLGLTVSLQGCAPVIIGGVAATTASLLHDRRTTGAVVEDEAIELRIKSALSKVPGMSAQTHINVTSYNGILLLTGEAPSEALRSRANDIAKQTRKVKRVHNEIIIAAPSAMMARSSDALLTSKVKASLLKVKVPGFDPTRVKVVTENGTVYLLGLVTRTEGDAATDIARRLGGVQRVVKLFEYLG
ncbi:MAG: BON domain-containing protein [Gammaproteobacteria bacterium]